LSFTLTLQIQRLRIVLKQVAKSKLSKSLKMASKFLSADLGIEEKWIGMILTVF